MATDVLTQDNFWRHDFTRSLTIRGKLALCYTMFFAKDNDLVLEDMSLWCDMTPGECNDWLHHFEVMGHLNPELRVF